MDRRTALKNATLLTGGVMSTAFISGFLSGCKPDVAGMDGIDYHLSQVDFQLLQSLADGLIPETETPGAVSLGVPEMVDAIVGHCYKKADQDNFQKHLNDIRKELPPDYVHMTTEKRTASLQALEQKSDLNKTWYNAYRELKGNIGACYLDTEYVGTQLTKYLPIPGAYEPCVPITITQGKAWTHG